MSERKFSQTAQIFSRPKTPGNGDLLGSILSKFEIRISKSETISKFEITLKSKTQVRNEFVWNIGFFVI
jgi:hypothetical protein